MNKKILIYALAVILVICAGILVVKNIVEGDNAIETSKSSNNIKENKIVNNTNIIKNEVENEIKSNIANEINNEIEITNKEDKVEEKEKALEIKEDVNINDNKEKAIDIAKKDWGEDDSVYFKFDRIDSNENYIVVVRDSTTTNALKWYTVDVENDRIID